MIEDIRTTEIKKTRCPLCGEAKLLWDRRAQWRIHCAACKSEWRAATAEDVQFAAGIIEEYEATQDER